MCVLVLFRVCVKAHFWHSMLVSKNLAVFLSILWQCCLIFCTVMPNTALRADVLTGNVTGTE